MIKKLPVCVRKWKDLPDKIKKLYEQDKPWGLEGTYGRMFMKDKTRDIEFFNLAEYVFPEKSLNNCSGSSGALCSLRV